MNILYSVEISAVGSSGDFTNKEGSSHHLEHDPAAEKDSIARVKPVIQASLLLLLAVNLRVTQL